MSDKNRYSIKSFFDSQLKIQLIDTWVLENDRMFFHKEKGYYKIIYFKEGDFLYYTDNSRISIEQGSMIIGKYNENDIIKSNIKLSDKYQKTELISILIHPTLFSKIKGDSDFFRAFINNKNIKDCLYNKSDFENIDIEETVFNNIVRYVENKLGLINFTGLISTLITEINLIYNKRSNYEFSSNSEEYMVKVYEYISNNFTQNITLESVANKFSVTPFYIEKVTKRFYSHTFLKTISNMRMWHARSLMRNNKSILLNDVAHLCGYSDYSAFYKAYSKFFKVSPKKDLEHLKKNNQFLSYTYNDN